MPCSSIYCLSNTGYQTFNDVYFSAGTHNSELYWTGQTNGLFIYYNTGTTQWCLSTALDGTCDLSGQSPCFNPCPDLDDVYFSSGTCPTPTPSPTQNCLSLNFTAFFDCDVPATPTPTPTITTSPSPTPTPSPTNLCNVVISATIQSVSPTPTPTPTITPSSSPVISRDCTFEQSVSFNTIEDSIVCPYSYQFQDCYNGKMYYTTNQIVTPTGNNITKFEVYRANVNEEIVCIHYVGVNNNTIGIDDITLISGPYGFSNLGDCIFCSQINTPTPTPTPTVTPSGMPSECITTCGLEGYAYTKT